MASAWVQRLCVTAFFMSPRPRSSTASRSPTVASRRMLHLWQKFPLSGRDVLGAGGGHGPAVGAFLKAVEAWWIAEDFGPDEAALRARLQQMIAAAQ